ncbi:hypothetical protein NDU88_004197 [Pleurodeles waltl]|uniref:Uncharacterized protein n=1 Tax=Pleurodeles waltl TaxID=8319 RepID=A0AAV7QE33_PLEWA|nr:hypothetical protein NDU88_004197 [Pleurodeles waltl]
MDVDAKVLEAVALLKQAGRMDLLKEEALVPGRPARRASAGVAAAVAACSPLRAVGGSQVWRECEWDAQLFTDAAGSAGFGLYWEGRWCAEEWPGDWKHGGRSIAFLEFFPLIISVCLWGAELSHSRVLFQVDNLAVVQMVNRQSAREAGLLQLLRVFVLQCLRMTYILEQGTCRG